MTLQTWHPFAQARRRNGFANPFVFPFTGYRRGADPSPGAWRIPVDIVDNGDEVVVSASVPGIDPADIRVNIEDGVLTIQATSPVTESAGESDTAESEYLRRERRAGTFSRAIRVADTIDLEKVTSEYSNGVLNVTLPKLETTRSREITVKVA